MIINKKRVIVYMVEDSENWIDFNSILWRIISIPQTSEI